MWGDDKFDLILAIVGNIFAHKINFLNSISDSWQVVLLLDNRSVDLCVVLWLQNIEVMTCYGVSFLNPAYANQTSKVIEDEKTFYSFFKYVVLKTLDQNVYRKFKDFLSRKRWTIFFKLHDVTQTFKKYCKACNNTM